MKVIASLFLMVLGTVLSAQSVESNNVSMEVLFENEIVKVEMDTEVCGDPHSDLEFEYYMLTVSNKSAEKLNLQYWSHGHENESSEFFHSLILAPGQTLEGTCTAEPGNGLKFFRKDVGTEEVGKLKLVDFSVNRL